ncbi:MAG: IS4 family transposase [Candidatus Thiosymbion ectosymbiont of Robbea hypermnestra]|nr:IS4 family transposase [Candidatus Thiosymbion ectosymbiont of Robbea hypermnestra]
MIPEDFTRQRALSLPHLVSMLLNLRKGSIGDELDRFFEVLHDQPLADSVSPSAFCQARMKLDPRALMALNRPLLEGFERDFTPRLWQGLRLLAVDGSTARLPNTDDVMATFGAPPEGNSVLLARLSRLYDVLNNLVIEAAVESRQVGERVLAGEHLAATRVNDLVLYDRGYPAFWLFALHHQEHRHFCARLPLDFSTQVSAFVASGKKSEGVQFTPGPHARQQCQVYGLSPDPIPLRLVRVKLKNGEIEVLATSLLDEQADPSTWFKHLYHLRWGVEEGYKREKCWLEIENFSGLSAHAVKQDFYAKLFVLNLTAVLSWVAQAIADCLYQERTHAYRVNFAQALSKMKDNLVRLFVSNASRQLLTALVLAMATCVEPVRPDRVYPRKIKPAKLHGFHPNFKRCR